MTAFLRLKALHTKAPLVSFLGMPAGLWAFLGGAKI